MLPLKGHNTAGSERWGKKKPLKTKTNCIIAEATLVGTGGNTKGEISPSIFQPFCLPSKSSIIFDL